MVTKSVVPDKYPGSEEYQARLKPILQGTRREDDIEEFDLILNWTVARYESAQDFRKATDNRSRKMLSDFDLEEPDMFAALATFSALEKSEQKTMAYLVQQHPMYERMVGFCGIDDVIAARLIGNLPDLWNFATVSKLWAFFHMDGDEWRELVKETRKGGKKRYRGSPQLRSLAWNMGRLIMQYGKEGAKKDPRFGLVCRERLLYEAGKPGCNKPLTNKKGVVYSDCNKIRCSTLHQERKAKVYAVKSFLAYLWEEWRRVMPEPIRA